MTEKKNPFKRAYEAIIDSRMRHAEHQIAAYREMFDLEPPRKGL